ncbi:hypothetical protein HN51_063421 [Arachis hypogaea]
MKTTKNKEKTLNNYEHPGDNAHNETQRFNKAPPHSGDLIVRSERVMTELDAAETKRQKTEHVEMAEEACLCLFTSNKLFVIKLSNLKKQEDDVKDWTCLPPPPFDFDLKLPDPDLCPFELDSKIYMAVSCPRPLGADSNSWNTYEFKFDERRFWPADGVPAPLYGSSIANTPDSSDVYFCIDPLAIYLGLFVLYHDSRVWKQLNPPPDYERVGADLVVFVFHNTVFVSSDTGNETDSYLAHFDPITETWIVEPDADNNLSKFMNGRYICSSTELGPFRDTYPPKISVPLLGLGSSNNYTVCLTHDEYGEEFDEPLVISEKVFAILVNYQNGRVALYQYLDVFFEGSQPKMEDGARVNLVDLGNGKDFAALQLDSGAPPMERDFLQVTVHKKCVYTMENSRLANDMRHTFVWPPIKGGRFHYTTDI